MNSSVESMKQIVTCAIHLELLNDPIMLKCQHVFCRSQYESKVLYITEICNNSSLFKAVL